MDQTTPKDPKMPITTRSDLEPYRDKSPKRTSDEIEAEKLLELLLED
jgi:hypothetical protein